ncbi:MAG: alkaline shock response membrane anchor protein AmaP [Candidatus Omnitrophota bacterium]
MRFFRGIAIILYTLIFVVVGGLLLLLALNFFSPDQVVDAVNYVYTQPNLKLMLGIVGAAFVLTGFLLAHLNLSRMQSEKTIAFENPEGQVTVSLTAIEDFIKKSVRHLPEVQELRPNVVASKKGINVVCRATIFADSNIPEATERIQGIVKSKVQEMLGVEETINIKIHVIKISSKGKGEAPAPVKEHDEASRRMPFRE